MYYQLGEMGYTLLIDVVGHGIWPGLVKTKENVGKSDSLLLFQSLWGFSHYSRAERGCDDSGVGWSE